MRYFRFAWPTVLAAMGCTTFTVASILTQTAMAVDIGQIFPTKSCSFETDDTTFFAYNSDYERGDNHECRDGDYYYQQKYGFIYSRSADRTARDMGMDADEVEAEEAAAKDVMIDDEDIEDNADIGEIDGTVPVGQENDNESYIYQYEEAGETGTEDPGVQENETQDADSEENEEGGYGYRYAFPQDLYGTSVMPSTNIFNVEETVMEQPWGDLNQYMDDRYSGSPYIVDYPYGVETDENLALFTWEPAELLTWSDQEILRLLATVVNQESGVRRAVLSDYIESLGMEAIDLSIRFEEVSGLVVPSLSDDLAQTAAFMACFRLVERGELEFDEALALLQKSLSHRSGRWNCWIDEVTRVRVTSNPMLKAVVRTAANSLERLGGAISGISRQIKNLY